MDFLGPFGRWGHDVKYVKCGLGVPDPHLWSAETKFGDFDGGFKHRLNHRVAYPFQDFNVQMFGGHQKMLEHKNWQAFGRHFQHQSLKNVNKHRHSMIWREGRTLTFQL
jgi:hypothetical protein